MAKLMDAVPLPSTIWAMALSRDTAVESLLVNGKADGCRAAAIYDLGDGIE
ncbi:hypothetical protein [Microseira wollei]|uniref:hypothetical protein n=1 Tax=Microseira wollei TaxID=467598 RepID=UPI001CFC619F|nr:hypothetical protein [Microseira wollei]